VYADDLTFGAVANLRGHWRDRLAAIDLDIGDMAAVLDKADAASQHGNEADRAASRAPTVRPHCEHVPVTSFRPGQPVAIELSFPGEDASRFPKAVRLHYRRVNQAEAYASIGREARAGRFAAEVPGRYTDSPYALQYFFELHCGSARPCLYPGLDLDTFSQPYFLVRQRLSG